MRNFLFTTLTLLASSIAFAAPKVGDYAKLSGTFIDKETNQMVHYAVSDEIIRFDAISDKFTVRTTEEFKTETEVWEAEKSADELDPSYDVASCENDKGTSVEITVAAGKLLSCRFPFGPASIKAFNWLADVPFGYVKMEFPGRHSIELTEYRFGR